MELLQYMNMVVSSRGSGKFNKLLLPNAFKKEEVKRKRSSRCKEREFFAQLIKVL